MIGLGLIAAGCLVWIGWRPQWRHVPQPPSGDATGFGRLLIVAMTAGLNLAESWQLAARYIGGSLGVEAAALERNARSFGFGAQLRLATGPLAPIAASIAQAQLLGSPVIPATRAAVDGIRSRSQTRRMERIRTLSVKLTLPVSLLLLPGFMMVVVFPYLIDGVGDLLPAFH